MGAAIAHAAIAVRVVRHAISVTPKFARVFAIGGCDRAPTAATGRGDAGAYVTCAAILRTRGSLGTKVKSGASPSTLTPRRTTPAGKFATAKV